jgi:3',5'-cyclic AMP phosphodiesterase CpdA
MGVVTLDIDDGARDAARSDADFVLAHLSDPHLSSLDGVGVRDLAGKRILGYVSWSLRRRHEHRSDVLDALRADIAARKPDHVAVTGDLTHLGLPREFRDAAAWLARLGAPETVSVVPGNHDAYAHEPWQETFAQWADYLLGDDAQGATDAGAAFPSLRVRRHVALIGLSSARPSAPFLATGALGAAQLQRLDGLLERTGSAGLFRVVLLHHPPAAHTVGWRKSLRDGAALRAVLDCRGAELILHGHAHFSAAAYLDAAHARNLAIGVPSASLVGADAERHATYHVYRVQRDGAGWRVRVSVRAFSLERGRFDREDGRRLRIALAGAA